MCIYNTAECNVVAGALNVLVWLIASWIELDRNFRNVRRWVLFSNKVQKISGKTATGHNQTDTIEEFWVINEQRFRPPS